MLGAFGDWSMNIPLYCLKSTIFSHSVIDYLCFLRPERSSFLVSSVCVAHLNAVDLLLLTGLQISVTKLKIQSELLMQTVIKH